MSGRPWWSPFVRLRGVVIAANMWNLMKAEGP
jgi:hypothetical protein